MTAVDWPTHPLHIWPTYWWVARLCLLFHLLLSGLRKGITARQAMPFFSSFWMCRTHLPQEAVHHLILKDIFQSVTPLTAHVHVSTGRLNESGANNKRTVVLWFPPATLFTCQLSETIDDADSCVRKMAQVARNCFEAAADTIEAFEPGWHFSVMLFIKQKQQIHQFLKET